MGHVENAIKIVYDTRNVPYRLGLDGDPKKLFREYRGNCARKCLYAAPKLIDEGYAVMLAIVTFSWSDLLPQFANLLVNPSDSHVAMLVKPPKHSEWVEVDPTWDPEMERFGFPVIEWDGLHGTGYGVKPIDNVKIGNLRMLQARVQASLMRTYLRSVSHSNKPTPFNDAVNKWLGRS